MYRNQFKVRLYPTLFEYSARRDESESRKSHPGDETNQYTAQSEGEIPTVQKLLHSQGITQVQRPI